MDNNLTLYYVEGISRVDTPFFSSLNSQKDFFNANKVKAIDGSFYPPFFEDLISFENDDLNLNTKVNYLSITDSSGKFYYYFIDDIYYTSRGIIKLKISMDVIQTYLFNSSLTNAIIERKFINRYNSDGTFNRNYMRENVSSGLFKLRREKFYNTNSDFSDSYHNDDLIGMLVFKLAKDIWATYADTKIIQPASIRTPGDEFYSPEFYYYIVPICKQTFNLQHIMFWDMIPNSEGKYNPLDDSADYYTKYNLQMTLYALCQDPSVVASYFVPMNNLFRLMFSKNSSGSDIYCNKDYMTVRWHNYGAMWADKVCACLIFREGPTIHFEDLIDDNFFTIDIHKNSEIEKDFKGIDNGLSNVPAVYDENYFRFSFGEGDCDCTYPLYYITDSLHVTAHYFSEIDSGKRYYRIVPLHILNSTEGNSYCYKDTYFTSTCCDSTLFYDLTSSSWTNYLAYNKWSRVGSLVGYAAKCFSFTYSAGNSISKDESNISSIMTNSSNYDKRYKTPVLKKKYANQVTAYADDINDTKSSATSTAIDNGESLIGTAVTEYNAWTGPNSARHQSSMLSDLLSKAAQIHSSIYECDNLSYCISYYHKNGYLVNEPVYSDKTLSYILDYLYNRHYFNIIKLKDCNVHLDVLEVSSITDLIRDRLISGFRYWNVQFTNIGDFTYDNVENDYINMKL